MRDVEGAALQQILEVEARELPPARCDGDGWRNEYGGLKSDQVKRLKELDTENARLRKAISDLTLDKLIMQEAARRNY